MCPADQEICVLIHLLCMNVCKLLSLCFGFSRKWGKIVVRWNMPCQLFFFLMKDPSSFSTPCNVCRVLHAVSLPSDLLTFFGQIKAWCNFPWVPSDTAAFWSHQSSFMMTGGSAAELSKFSSLSAHGWPPLSGKSKLCLERVSLAVGKWQRTAAIFNL